MNARARTRRVTLSKPAGVIPVRVIAGGLEWRADEDGRPFGALIGFELAVARGVHAKPRAGAR